jgi:uncharacterized protein
LSPPLAETCLVLMLKAPGRSKRRLASEIGHKAAVEAAACLAACALEDLAEWPGAVCVAPAAESDLEWLRGQVPAAQPVVMQRAGNLGERISHVSRELHGRGVRRQLFIGIDCPELDQAYLQSAAASLEESDAVLGPADDGGVVLMGTRRPWPDLAALPWSTDALHAALRALCEAHGFTVAALEPRTDIDTWADLAGLEGRLGSDRRPARQTLTGWLACTARTREDR